MSTSGWRSRTTVEKARSELELRGWIVRTRQGSLGNRCNLYALTWLGIDDCKGKLDVPPSPVALGFWKTGTNPWLERDRSVRPRGKTKRAPGICASTSQPDQRTGKTAHAPGQPGPATGQAVTNG